MNNKNCMNQTEEFSFPYSPYEIQTRLMCALRDCLQTGRVGIFESPTGTGKSLSTICATLTWLEQHEEAEKSRLQDEVNQADALSKEDDEKEEDWVAAYRRKHEAREKASGAEEKLEVVRRIEERLNKARKHDEDRKRRRNDLQLDDATVEDGGDPEESDLDICPKEDYSSDGETEPKEDEPELSCTKIYYASRTHSQLEQFCEEVFKTRFRPRMVAVGSRNVLCLNPSVLALKSASLMNERCTELRQNGRAAASCKRAKEDNGKAVKKSSCGACCSFWKSDAIEDLADQILSLRTQSLAKVTEAGKRLSGCAYFASRQALPLCQLVLLPYQVLLHSATREAWGVKLAGNVVVIDEAHNLLQTVADIHSAELSLTAIATALTLIRDYIDRFRGRLKAKNLLYIRQLLVVTTALNALLSSYSSKGTDTVFTMSKLLIELNVTEIDFFKILRYMEDTQLCKKFHGFFIRYKNNPRKASENSSTNEPKCVTGVERLLRKANATASSSCPDRTKEQLTVDDQEKQVMSSPLFAIKQFLECLTTRCSDARVVVATESADRPARLKFLLLNPAEKLTEVVKQARSVILIGGTMEPADQLLHSLHKVCKVPQENVVRFSCDHVIDDNQLVAITVGKAPDGSELSLTYGSRSTAATFNGVAMTFLNLIRYVPNGVVAFFPSYDYMNWFAKMLRASPLFNKIAAIKRVLFETKANGSKLWAEFVRDAQSPKGALLCAVVGGKLSEGINFSDELGRCVFMVGLPYPNKNSVELNEKMKYLNATMGDGAGGEMYESLCLHAVNQAIGRVIRHRNDFAAIVLIDSRYSRPSIIKGLPRWIVSRLKVTNRFGEAVSLMSDFFRSRRQTLDDVNKVK